MALQMRALRILLNFMEIEAFLYVAAISPNLKACFRGILEMFFVIYLDTCVDSDLERICLFVLLGMFKVLSYDV